jgi:hypothetical protein
VAFDFFGQIARTFFSSFIGFACQEITEITLNKKKLSFLSKTIEGSLRAMTLYLFCKMNLQKKK